MQENSTIGARHSVIQLFFEPKQMSADELVAGYDRFRGEFLSWQSICRRLGKSRINLTYTLPLNLGYRNAYLAYRK